MSRALVKMFTSLPVRKTRHSGGGSGKFSGFPGFARPRDKELGWLSPDLDGLDEKILSKSETANLQAKTPPGTFCRAVPRLAPRELD